MNYSKNSAPLLTLSTKRVYGTDLIYPACEDSKVFAKLIGKKTFSTIDISLIQQLGYEIEYTN